MAQTAANAFPLDDWQFWLASAVAALAVLWLVRAPLRRLLRRKPKPARSRAALTVGGKPLQTDQPSAKRPADPHCSCR